MPSNEQDRPLEEAVVDEGHARVEAEVEGEIPGERDEARVDNDLPDPVPVDEPHQEARTGTADRIVSTTSSCLSGSMPAQSGRATSSARGALGLRERARLVAEVGEGRLEVERRRVVGSRADLGVAKSVEEPVALLACGRRTCGTRGPARPRAAHRAREGPARDSGPRPHAGAGSSGRAPAGRARSAAAWISSSREL